MGYGTFSQSAYQSAAKNIGSRATTRGEESLSTGKLNPLVDPAEYGVIRHSRPRFDELSGGKWLMTIGTPIASETRSDSTGSWGDNVDIAMRVLPDTYLLSQKMLPGYDLHVALGIFGDCRDQFVLCRPQFEMTAPKLVEQLSLMAPEGGGGGNGAEDPQYGLFGAAFLTSAYCNRIGLKRYDFTISDEPARPLLSLEQLVRIFGDEVLTKAHENGFDMDGRNLPTTKEVVKALLEQAHAFFLEGGRQYPNTHSFWVDLFGEERVVVLPNANVLPHVQATIIGLTEGTLSLVEVVDFLRENEVGRDDARRIAMSVANIPVGAQQTLREEILKEHQIPKKGDIFAKKTDLWPMDMTQFHTADGGNSTTSEDGSTTWL